MYFVVSVIQSTWPWSIYMGGSIFDLPLWRVGSLCDQEVACLASDRQGSNFESCDWRTVSSHLPKEVLLAQFSLYVHNPHCKTFTDVEFHQPGLLQLGNSVKIHLEPVDVVLVSNMSIQNTVICEQTNCTVGDAIR